MPPRAKRSKLTSSSSSTHAPDLLQALIALDETSTHSFSCLELSAMVQNQTEQVDDDTTIHHTRRKSKTSTTTTKRTSDASDAANKATKEITPLAMHSDIINYKEHFSKLRFSYLEQITKEKFIEAITSETPQIVEGAEVDEMEEMLAGKKTELAGLKLEMGELIRELEGLGRKVGGGYEGLNEKVEVLKGLPREIEKLEKEIEEETVKARSNRRSSRLSGSLNPEEDNTEDLTNMNLPLDETIEMVRAQEAQLEALTRELSTLEKIELPRKRRAFETLEKEIKPLEEDKEDLVKFANEVARMREGERLQGRADRENMGRWYKATQETLSQLVAS